MLAVRNGWVGRTLAAMLIASMLATLVVPRARTPAGSQVGNYERWIRAQLRISPDDFVEMAITSAVSERVDSFQKFVAAFLQVYEDAAPERAISLVFTDRELSTDALISYLERRYNRVVYDAVFPRIYVATASHHAGAAGKTGGSVGRSGSRPATPAIQAIVGGARQIAKSAVVPFRALSSARPLGP